MIAQLVPVWQAEADARLVHCLEAIPANERLGFLQGFCIAGLLSQGFSFEGVRAEIEKSVQLAERVLSEEREL